MKPYGGHAIPIMHLIHTLTFPNIWVVTVWFGLGVLREVQTREIYTSRRLITRRRRASQAVQPILQALFPSSLQGTPLPFSTVFVPFSLFKELRFF
jgi:hypothetical protein